MRSKLVLITCAAAVTIGLVACGDDGGSDDAASTDETTANAAAGGAVVQVGQTDLGEVLTSSEGLTLYAFTNDTGGVSTCEDACADAWPAVLVDSADLPEGLDPNVFSVTPRNDGTFQLAAANQPLYTFAGDSAPGDINGQGSGGVWFAVAPDGQLIQGDASQAGGGGAGSPGGGTESPEDQGSTESTDETSEDTGYGY